MKTNPFLLSLPVLIAYIPLGVAFGILAASRDFSFLELILSSLIVYAGAGQFALVALIDAKAGFFEVFFALFLLNFRHFFYTLSLLKELKELNCLRHYIMFALTDESFALLSTQKSRLQNLCLKKKSFILFLLCFLNQMYWIIGSVLGFLFQKNVRIDYSGIEFSLNALFIVLSYELYKQNPNRRILLFSCMVSLFALICVDKTYMFAFCLGFGIVLFLFGKKYV